LASLAIKFATPIRLKICVAYYNQEKKTIGKNKKKGKGRDVMRLQGNAKAASG